MTAPLNYHVLDVFTEQPLSGNPLAVVMDADGLDGAHMQAIAREFNLSETVFVLEPRRREAAAQLRIFTPDRELPFAGHPTVGAACLLAELGRVRAAAELPIVFEEEIGPVPVLIRSESGRSRYAQLTTAVLPTFAASPLDAGQWAAMFGLSTADIETVGDQPRGASCGVAFDLVPLRSRDALTRARLPARATAGTGSDSYYLYFRENNGQLHARMFAPGMGLGEDPATGAAAAALCGHLADRSPQTAGSLSWTIMQGVEIRRPSRIDIEADKHDGRITAVRVGGHAVRIASGSLAL